MGVEFDQFPTVEMTTSKANKSYNKNKMISYMFFHVKNDNHVCNAKK